MKKLKLLVPSILATAIVVVDLLLNLPETSLPISIWLAFGLVALQIGVLYLEVEKYQNLAPALEFRGIEFLNFRPGDGGLKRIKSDVLEGRVVSYVLLEVVNSPKKRLPESSARNAFASISVFDREGRERVSSFTGVWAVDYVRPIIGDRFEEKITISSNGFPAYLVLAQNSTIFTSEDPVKAKSQTFDRSDFDHRFAIKRKKDLFEEKGKVYYRIEISAENMNTIATWVYLELISRDSQNYQFSSQIIEAPPFDPPQYVHRLFEG